MNRYDIVIDGTPFAVEIVSESQGQATVRVNGVTHQVQTPVGASAPRATAAAPEAVRPSAPAPEPAARPAPAPAPSSAPISDVGGDAVLAPMPGNVVNVLVQVGDTVASGTTLLTLEAMKMENEINSPKAGRILAIHVTKGQAVKVNQPLVAIGS